MNQFWFCWWFGRNKPDDSVLVLPNHQHTLKVGTELVTEMLGNILILTRLYVRENSVSAYKCAYSFHQF